MQMSHVVRKDEVHYDVTSSMSSDGVHLQRKAFPNPGFHKRYDNINFCTYCQKGVKSKISRHLLTHAVRGKIMEIKMLPKKSKEREILFTELVNEGNYKHNFDVLKCGEGVLVTSRRESPENFKYSPYDYLPCEFCKGFYLKHLLWSHAKHCKLATGKGNKPVGISFVRKGRTLLYGTLYDENESDLTQMLLRMNEGPEKNVIRKDVLIKNFASIQIQSLGEVGIQKKNDIYRVSSNCRILARLVIAAQKDMPLTSLNNLLTPRHFDTVVKYTRQLSSEATTLAPKIGHLISHCIMVKQGYAIRKQDDSMLVSANHFKKVFDSEWGYRVNAPARKKKNVNDLNTLSKIPETNDLVKFRDFMTSEVADSIKAVKETPGPVTWNRLAKCTMCRLILFNKRRVVEVEDLYLNAYLNRPEWTATGEFKDVLTDMEKMFAKRMDMVECLGKSKKNSKVYIILTPDAKNALELLVKYRDAVEVPLTNKYMFARLNANTPLSGTSTLKELLDKCKGLESPEKITSTSLRKYIATVSQILDMTLGELNMLAKHLGHDVKTHKEYYQLSSSVLELSKVARMLYAVESGKVNVWSGKQMKDIELTDIPLPEEDIEPSLEVDRPTPSHVKETSHDVDIPPQIERSHDVDIPPQKERSHDVDIPPQIERSHDVDIPPQKERSHDVDIPPQKERSHDVDIPPQKERSHDVDIPPQKERSHDVDIPHQEEPTQDVLYNTNRGSKRKFNEVNSKEDDNDEKISRNSSGTSFTKNPIVRRGMKRRWVEEENMILGEIFKIQLQQKQMPSHGQLMHAVSRLNGRTMQQIRTKVNNIICNKQKFSF